MDPYTSGNGTPNFYHVRRQINGSVVAVMQGGLKNRGLQLIGQPSRALCQGELHELIVSTEENIGPGSTVNEVAYIGFVEISQSGVVCAGDVVSIDGREIGVIAGYDYTHMPNHMNIVIRAQALKSGEELGIQLGQSFTLGAR